MGYVPLNNYKYDSGYRRIQSGPNHQGFIVLTSGSSAYGVNNGIIVPGSPLSGTETLGAWDYDSNWRYIPTALLNRNSLPDPTPYNASGALDTYGAARIYTRDNVAGAQAASAIGPETGKVNPRGAALQPRADVTRPEKYMYFGGGAPDNQNYSPYNTPDANTAAEGKTGGGVTHRNYESSLLTNLLGSQGTSDRSQWRYHQPVYCKTFTETQRSTTPGLMSSPLRYVYRGQATSYNYNYGSELLANKTGFEILNYNEFSSSCDIPPGCPIRTGPYIKPASGDILTAQVYCPYDKIEWFNTSGTIPIGSGETYTLQTSDYNTRVFYVVTAPDESTTSSSIDCLPPVDPYASWPSDIPTPNDPDWPAGMPPGVEPIMDLTGWVAPPRTWDCSESRSSTVTIPTLNVRSYNGSCVLGAPYTINGFSATYPFPILGAYVDITPGACNPESWGALYYVAIRGSCSGINYVQPLKFYSAGIPGQVGISLVTITNS